MILKRSCQMLMFLTWLVGSASAQNVAFIYSFQGPPDGEYPDGGVIADAAGNLYGTTPQGGTNNCYGGAFFSGIVYELTPPVPPGSPWTETILHTCDFSGDGLAPTGELIFDKAGNLYGTTGAGGTSTNCTYGCGTVFELSPPSEPGGEWTETILYNFDSGVAPNGGLIFDKAGNLYGTTFSGGTGNCTMGGNVGCGIVFELSPPSMPGGTWTFTLLYSFLGGDDGAFPTDPVIFDSAGNLYGTTQYGGGNLDTGTVFELTPSPGGTWSEVVLHSFGSVENDGLSPNSPLLLVVGGQLLGTTPAGGRGGSGTAFSLRPPTSPGGSWNYTILHHFGFGTDGRGPATGLALGSGGVVYGTTTRGGTGMSGTIFKLVPFEAATASTMNESVLYNFTLVAGGLGPEGGSLLLSYGALYGTTYYRGKFSRGAVFRYGR